MVDCLFYSSRSTPSGELPCLNSQGRRLDWTFPTEQAPGSRPAGYGGGLPGESQTMAEVTAGSAESLTIGSGTMKGAIQAARQGATDAKEAAEKAWSATGAFLAQAIYNTTYAVSYGVVFPAAFVGRRFPAITRRSADSSRGHRRQASAPTRFSAGHGKLRPRTENRIAGGCQSCSPGVCNGVVAGGRVLKGDERSAIMHRNAIDRVSGPQFLAGRF